MDDMKVGDSTNSGIDSSSNDNSDYASSSLEDVSTDSQLKSDLQSNDKQTQKAAMDHLVKLILDALKSEQGKGEPSDDGSNNAGSQGNTESGEGAGDSPSGLEDLVKALIKQVADEAGLSDMQAGQLGKNVDSTMEGQGLTETAEAT
jgi:hypothetical protein